MSLVHMVASRSGRPAGGVILTTAFWRRADTLNERVADAVVARRTEGSMRCSHMMVLGPVQTSNVSRNSHNRHWSASAKPNRWRERDRQGSRPLTIETFNRDSDHDKN